MENPLSHTAVFIGCIIWIVIGTERPEYVAFEVIRGQNTFDDNMDILLIPTEAVPPVCTNSCCARDRFSSLACRGLWKWFTRSAKELRPCIARCGGSLSWVLASKIAKYCHSYALLEVCKSGNHVVDCSFWNWRENKYDNEINRYYILWFLPGLWKYWKMLVHNDQLILM